MKFLGVIGKLKEVSVKKKARSKRKTTKPRRDPKAAMLWYADMMFSGFFRIPKPTA